MAINPNWPVLMVDWGPYWNCNGATFPDAGFSEVTSRTRGHVSIQRGRQFELDQVRASTLDMQLANADGALDPLNAAGPWYGHITPYQPARARAQWPPTANLLTQAQATGGDLGGYTLGTCRSQAGLGVISATDPTNWGSIVNDVGAWQGGRVFQFPVPISTTAATPIAYSYTVGGERLITYTAQMRVRNVTAGTTLQVQAYVDSANAVGSSTRTNGTATTLTGSTTAPWTQITVTATLAADAAYMSCGVALATTNAAAATLQLDGWQLEKAASASTWTAPGTWYPMYAGWVERYPASWAMDGTYGMTTPTCTDTFSLLSQRLLRDPLVEEIYSRNPRFLYSFADPQDSNSFADSIGAYPPAPLAVSKYGPGSISAGNQITAATPTGTYVGSSGTVITVTNPNPGVGSSISPATFVSLSSAGITGPTNPGGSWTRMIAFRYTASTPAQIACMWSCFDGQRAADSPSGSRLLWNLDNAGRFSLWMYGPTGAGAAFTPTPTLVDGNWHLAIISYSHATATLVINLDGTNNTWTSVNPALEPSGLLSDNLGSYVDPTAGNGTTSNWQGDLSFACEWPTALSSSAMSSIYTAWKRSFAGDSSDARYSRILGWAGYTGPTSIQAGLTRSMGAAAVEGQDALSALQAVVDTESGAHYVDRAGAIVFKARSDRYNALVPTWTFGENTASGEIPYEDIQLDFDPTRLANQITVTQSSTSQAFRAQDTTSITNFFPRQLSRTTDAAQPQECQDAANYLLSRYKNPAVRIAALKLHPSANPSVMWPVCLSLELGTRARVMRRPLGAPPIQVECFVESIQWDWDDQGDAFVTLQCSPADTTPYGLLAAFHTTLNTTIASGVNSIVIKNAPGQNNTDPAAAQIPAGGQLILGLGTANQETVTIKSVGATTAGWTTATITLTANTTKGHTANDVVCEALPAGVTDATTWDAVARFDQSAFAY